MMVETNMSEHILKEENEARFNKLLEFLQGIGYRDYSANYIPSIRAIMLDLKERKSITCWDDFLDMIESDIK